MNYLMTGATGFIGRFLVEELLKRPDACIYAVVRPGSEHKLDAIREQLGATEAQLSLVSGDLTQPGMGIAETDVHRLKGQVDHVFHLAAIYDLAAPAGPQQKANVEGTRHALQAAKAMDAGCFHHASSIAVAGLYPGHFDETMFEEAEGLRDPYFVTKHLAERCVRDEAEIPYRIYRPSMVVGHSKTGEMDKMDGPYYIFHLLEVLGKFLPRWLPLLGIEGGQFNIVPVDYVAQTMDHIAHVDGLDGGCFHLTDGNHYSLGRLMDLVSAQSGALPTFRWQLSNETLDRLPEDTIQSLPERRWVQRFFSKVNVPASALGYVTYPTTYGRTETERALEGSGITPPVLEEYIPILWQYWREHLSPQKQRKTALVEDAKNRVLFRKPTLAPFLTRAKEHWRWNLRSLVGKDKALYHRVNGKVVLLTGASSGIGADVANRLAAAGATVLLVARSKEKLDDLANSIHLQGGKACVYPADLSDGDDCDRVCQQITNDHGGVDLLINNAGRSIRRSIKFSFDRFHDYERTMQVNYFGSVRMAMNLLPGMLARGDGHVINVSTVGVQASPARFSAYLASKWALEGWSWVAANELAHTGVTVSTINYPLVRTPMIAPTKIYDYMPVMSPEKAVDWMLDMIITRNKRKVGVLGVAALGMYYLLPKTSESIVNTSYQVVYEAPPATHKRSPQPPADTTATNSLKDVS